MELYKLHKFNCFLIGKGLNELLEFPETEVEDTLMQTFSISYKDVFGAVYQHELKVTFFFIHLIPSIPISSYVNFFLLCLLCSGKRSNL